MMHGNVIKHTSTPQVHLRDALINHASAADPILATVIEAIDPSRWSLWSPLETATQSPLHRYIRITHTTANERAAIDAALTDSQRIVIQRLTLPTRTPNPTNPRT